MGLLDRMQDLADRSQEWGKGFDVTTDDDEEATLFGLPQRPKWGRRTFSDRDRDPRPLNSGDVTDFMIASGEASELHRKEMEKAYPPMALEVERVTFLRWVERRNARRLNRLGRELDWLRSEARKFGIDPEEIRWLL